MRRRLAGEYQTFIWIRCKRLIALPPVQQYNSVLVAHDPHLALVGGLLTFPVLWGPPPVSQYRSTCQARHMRCLSGASGARDYQELDIGPALYRPSAYPKF
ncbi:hypothetical protein AcV7_010280 [Taiwanofungus camphoratus]|nr:hypothetical protein AcV7_010280 [Antrodia cinnamomea]